MAVTEGQTDRRTGAPCNPKMPQCSQWHGASSQMPCHDGLQDVYDYWTVLLYSCASWLQMKQNRYQMPLGENTSVKHSLFLSKAHLTMR